MTSKINLSSYWFTSWLEILIDYHFASSRRIPADMRLLLLCNNCNNLTSQTASLSYNHYFSTLCASVKEPLPEGTIVFCCRPNCQIYWCPFRFNLLRSPWVSWCRWSCGQKQNSLRTVPSIVIAHTFCASPDTRLSYRQCLLILGYFCAI